MSKREIVWQSWDDAVHVSEEDREEWAQELVPGVEKTAEMASIDSGDSLVLVWKRSDGVLEIFDCQVRRRGVIKKA
jgi:hypothetical protein